MENKIIKEYDELLDLNVKLMDKNKELFDELVKHKEEIEELKTRLKKYINPDSKKKYYEKNRDKINKKSMEYQKKNNYHKNYSPEKIREYNKRAYEKRKQKLAEQED